MNIAWKQFAVVGIASVLAACVVDSDNIEAVTEGEERAPGDDARSPTPRDLDASLAVNTVAAGYTAWTSEEYTPIGSAPLGLLANLVCSGSNCDNIRAYVIQPSSHDTGAPLSIAYGASYWTSYFSEEITGGRTNYRECPQGYWVTALDCNGSYCDDISLRCTHIPGLQRVEETCGWSSPVYSGGSPDVTWDDPRIVGLLCTGPYCRELRMLRCSTRM